MHDVLTDVLNALRLRSSIYCQSEINKQGWALRFGQMPRAAFHIVSRGYCWLMVDPTKEPMCLAQGDLLVLPFGTAHTLADAPESPLCANIQLNDDSGDSCLLMKWGDDGPNTTLVCGTFDFDERDSDMIFALLPPMLSFSAEQVQQYGLQPTIHALIEEANAQRPGKQTILTRLSDVLLVLVLRAWLADPANEASGWLGALRDAQIAAALSCIHTAPEQDWTVARLATEVAMSRSAFAARFTALVGEPPLRYLTRWRMQVAARLLHDPALSLTHVATQVGYESELAFSKAFKRARGINPSKYQKRSNQRLRLN